MDNPGAGTEGLLRQSHLKKVSRFKLVPSIHYFVAIALFKRHVSDGRLGETFIVHTREAAVCSVVASGCRDIAGRILTDINHASAFVHPVKKIVFVLKNTQGVDPHSFEPKAASNPDSFLERSCQARYWNSFYKIGMSMFVESVTFGLAPTAYR